MFKWLFIILGIYILYRFIFDFALPIYKTTKQVRRQFQDVQDRMQEQMRAQNGYKQGPQAQPESQSSTKPKGGDYIEFEEIK